MDVLRLSLRMCDEDRATYGGDEWVEYDENLLTRIEWDTWIAIEAEWKAVHGKAWTLVQFAADANEQSLSGLVLAAMLWLPRRVRGDEDCPPWAGFKPRLGAITWKISDSRAAGDDVPPVPSSEPSSEETQSRSHSDASTPGSPTRRTSAGRRSRSAS